MSYGERFRLLRERRSLTQEQVAASLKYKRPAPVSLIERKSTRMPRPRTIRKHALALGCEPWELLAGVPTDYDWLRTPRPLTAEEMDVLLSALAYLKGRELQTALATWQTLLDAHRPPTPGSPRQVPRSDPAPAATASQKPRGKKRA